MRESSFNVRRTLTKLIGNIFRDILNPLIADSFNIISLRFSLAEQSKLEAHIFAKTISGTCISHHNNRSVLAFLSTTKGVRNCKKTIL